MTEEPSSDLLGALPRTRPHRRSDKRPARITEPAGGKPSPPTAKSAAARPKAATPRAKAAPRARAAPHPKQAPPARKPAPATGVAIVGTAVQAAAEIAEIGLTVSRKALRNAIARLPRP